MASCINNNSDAFQDVHIDEYYFDVTTTGKDTSAAALSENPYPGLRPFQNSENAVFLGREGLSTELIKKLSANRFLSVLGASGTGKSSLVRAGLLPALSILPGRNGAWRIAIFRPGKNPFGNLTKALLKGDIFSKYNQDEVLQTLSTSSFGFEKLYMAEANTETHNNLIIVDQFEELFRYKNDNGVSGRNEAALFVKMLIDISCNEKLNTYVMITMRSEFLGDCIQLRGLPEAINSGQYLVPRLRSDQLIDAITEPTCYTGAEIESGFAEKLLGEIGDDMDQLPVLQHALRRTYEEAKKNKINDIVAVTYKNYSDIGKMEFAIDKHANEIYESLSDEGKKYCEVIFKIITDKATDGRGIRRPLTFRTICKICEEIFYEPHNKVQKLAENVINAFRKDKVNFLLPALLPEELSKEMTVDDCINDDVEIDISHESIMRVWKKLVLWIEDEADDAHLLRQLLNRDSTDYLKGALLIKYEEWLNTKENAFTWAGLYKTSHVDEQSYFKKFKDGIFLIKNSVEKEKEDKENEERKIFQEQQREKEKIIEEQQREREKQISKRNRLIAVISIAAAIISISLGVYASVQNKKLTRATIEKAAADQRNRDAEKQFELASAQAEAKRKFDSLETLAEAKRRIDSASAQANAKRKIDSANAEAENQKKIESATRENYKKALRTARLDVLALTSEAFYQSPFLEQSKKDLYVDSLIELKFGENHDTAKANELLFELNALAEVKALEQTDPNKALIKAKQFHDLSATSFIDSTMFDVCNNNLFYTQNISLPTQYGSYPGKYYLNTLSKSKNVFAIKLPDTIKIFSLKNNNISELKSIPIVNTNQSNIYYSGNDRRDAMSFENDTMLIAFIENKIYKINISSNTIDSLTISDSALKNNVNDKYYVSSLSPNGKNLAIDYKDYNIKIWDINNINKPDTIKLDQRDGLVEDIIFSDDSKKIIVKQSYNYRVLNIPNYSDKKITYTKAVFTPDSKNIIFQSSPGIYSLTNLNDSIIDVLNFSELSIKTFENATVNLFTLSPDWKKFLLNIRVYSDSQYLNKTFLFKKDNDDSIFSFNTSKNILGGELTELPYSYSGSISFIDANNFIGTTSENSKLYLKYWRKFAKTNTLKDVDSLIKIFPSELVIQTNLPDIILNIDTITNEKQLDSAGNIALQDDSRALQKITLNDSKKIFDRLTDLDAKEYLNKYRILSRNYFTYYADTAERIKDLKKIIQIEKVQLGYNESDSLKNNISDDCWDLSWYLIFNKEFDSSAFYASAATVFYERNDGANTNLALSYLLNNDCQKADSIYKKYKGKKYLRDNRDFTKSFLQDLEDLESAGVIIDDNKEIYKHVQKIKQYLNNETDTLDCLQ